VISKSDREHFGASTVDRKSMPVTSPAGWTTISPFTPTSLCPGNVDSAYNFTISNLKKNTALSYLHV